MTDVDHNPFNGEREPTNEELLANWRTFMFVCLVAFVFLTLEAACLGQGWAAQVLPHAVIVWLCLALLTWWRWIGISACVFVLAAIAGVRAFRKSWSDEWPG